MKSVRIFLSTVLFVFTPLIFSQENLEQNDQMKITQILKKTKEYCERLNQVALYFVCKEEISEKYNVQRFNPTNKLAKMMIGQKHELLYDYQLIRKGKQKEEKRILLEEDGIRKKEEVKSVDTKMFQYRNVMFGPNNLLTEDRQPYFNYKLVGSELLNGEKALIIEVIPTSWLSNKILSGKIWVSDKDFSILRISWDEDMMTRSGVIKQLAKEYDGKPRFIQITDFGFEKNGKKKVHSEMNVFYKDYQFFTVETDVKMKKRPEPPC